MNPNDVIEAFVRDVMRRVPAKDRNDIGMELRGLLAEMLDRGSLCFVAPGGDATWLTPRAERFAGVRDLDSARLEAALEGSGAAVSYQHGYAEAVARLADEAESCMVHVIACVRHVRFGRCFAGPCAVVVVLLPAAFLI